jgi:hypothetical protein
MPHALNARYKVTRTAAMILASEALSRRPPKKRFIANVSGGADVRNGVQPD